MAFPTIVFNSVTGSNTAASGAGPATALTGSAASTSGTGLVVTLDGSPDLSGVATDGSHVIWLNDSTASARNFAKITAKDNVAKTVTVANAFGLSLSGKSWAIGGKRLSFAGSSQLYSNPDMLPGWIVNFDSGYTETFSSRVDVYAAPDTTSGAIIFQATPGYSTRPVFTLTSGADWVPRQFQIYKNLEFVASPGTDLIQPQTISSFIGCKFSSSSTAGGILISGSRPVQLINCTFIGGNTAVYTYGIKALGCFFSGQGYAAAYFSGTEQTGYIWDSIITNAGAYGIRVDVTRADTYTGIHIDRCVIYNSAIDGIFINGDFAFAYDNTSIINNIISNNGGYGIRLTSTYAQLQTWLNAVLNNNTYNNTSGAYIDGTSSYAYNTCPWASGDPNLDPQFTSVVGNDFSIGTNLKALGYPTSNIGINSATRSYVDIGAAQRQETSSGGSGLATNVFGG